MFQLFDTMHLMYFYIVKVFIYLITSLVIISLLITPNLSLSLPVSHLNSSNTTHSQKKKVQKLSLGLYLFKRYAFVP